MDLSVKMMMHTLPQWPSIADRQPPATRRISHPVGKIVYNAAMLLHAASARKLVQPVITITLFILIAWLYRQETPLLETPDEPAHFSVMAYIAAERRLPPIPTEQRQGPAPTVSSGPPAYYSPPLYYLMGALLVGDRQTADFPTAVIPNLNFARGVGLDFSPTPGNKNMYVHTPAELSRQADWAIAMWRVRWLSLLLGGVTIAAAWGLVVQLWTDRRWQLTAVCLLLFNSTFLYLSNGITDDMLIIPICTATAALLVHLAQHPRSKIGWREPALFCLIGLGLLTKQTAVILLPPTLLVLVEQGRQQAWSLRRWVNVGLLGMLLVGLVGGSWYANNWWQTGDLLGLTTHNPLPETMHTADRLRFLGEQGWGAFKSFWAAYGWATLFLPPGWYLFFGLLTLLGLSGWLLPADQRQPAWPPLTKRLLWLLVLLNGGLMMVWLWRTAAPYGRLLFPVIGPIACLLTEGGRRWLGRLPYPPLAWGVQTAVLGTLALLALLVPGQVLSPSFASPVWEGPLPATARPTDVLFAETVRLLGVELEPDSLSAGDTLTATLYWQRLQPAASLPPLSLTVQLSLQDPQQHIATAHQLLGPARHPAPVWQPNDIIAQTIYLTLDNVEVAPARYWLNVWLTDDQRRVRLPVLVDDLPQETAVARVADFRLTNPTPAPRLSQPVNFRLGEAATIDSYTLRWDAVAQALLVDVRWTAHQPLPEGWQIFVHLVDANGRLLTQADQPPRAGDYPTAWWQPDESWIDHYTLTDLTADQLTDSQLLIGLYLPEQAQRLPVYDADGQPVPSMAAELPVLLDPRR